MDRFVDYINSSLPDKRGDNVLYKFKKKTLDEMNIRRGEVLSRGIQNQQVADDLIISEHADLMSEYQEYSDKEYKKIKAKRNTLFNIIGSAIYLIVVVVAFLAISFATHAWNMTWGIIVDGVLIWVSYLLFLGVKKFTSMKKIFHIFARIFLAGAVMVLTVAVFIFVIAATDDLPKTWLILIFGLIYMFVCDGAYAVIAKHRLAIINCLIYIPVISVFLFIIIGALAIIPWKFAWIIIPLSLVIDLIIILISIAKNKAEKLEVADIWNEN